jgi:hypothetical protein
MTPQQALDIPVEEPGRCYWSVEDNKDKASALF